MGEHERGALKILALLAVALMVILATYAMTQAVYDADSKARFDTTDLTKALGGAASNVKSQMDQTESRAALWAKSTGQDASRATAEGDLFFQQLDKSAGGK